MVGEDNTSEVTNNTGNDDSRKFSMHIDQLLTSKTDTNYKLWILLSNQLWPKPSQIPNFTLQRLDEILKRVAVFPCHKYS